MDNGRISELLTKVRRPPGETLPRGVSEGDLEEFSDRTGIPLPNDLRKWLMLTNGPCVGPGGLFGIRPIREFLDIETCLGLYPQWKEKQRIPIAGDGCGNYYVMPTQDEYGKGFPVLFFDTIESLDVPAYIVASDLSHFLVFLLEKELGSKGWPFDEKEVAQKDPRITEFVGVPLPWAKR
jgi:hypothetical protein